MNQKVKVSPEVEAALNDGKAIVALESTVIAHGLPWPDNLNLAKNMENLIREQGAVPATIAVIDGVPCAGLDEKQLLRLAESVNGKDEVRKLSRRDMGAAVAQKLMGATTVASTMLIAHLAGIQVFATGGIGGVHRGDSGDVSADLLEFSQTPVAVVCAGAKSILDLPRTLEWLETFGVPVLGFQTNEFPAFYTRTSGLKLVDSMPDAEATAALINAHWSLGLKSGVLIANPIPEAAALNPDDINPHIEKALEEADKQYITGKDITPFLLSRLVQLTGGKSLQANLALLKNNGRVAAEIAIALTQIP